MGQVYQATDTRLHRTVAIKVLPPRFTHSLEMKQRFDREAQVIAGLNHPHICTLYDVGRQGETDAPNGVVVVLNWPQMLRKK